VFQIVVVGTRHAHARVVSKMIVHAHFAQWSFMAVRAIGRTVAVTGETSVGSRAFQKKFFPTLIVEELVFVFQSRPSWRVARLAIRSVGARETLPLGHVVGRVVQVFGCFASTPRRRLTACALVVGNFARRETRCGAI